MAMRKFLYNPMTWGVVALVLGTGMLVSSARDDGSEDSLPYGSAHFDWVPPAASLDRLVSDSDIVVIGRFTKVVSVDSVAPIEIRPGSHEAGISPGIEFTNLEVQVLDYVKGNGPTTLVVRQTGNLVSTQGFEEFPKPRYGESTLLFLTREEGRGDNVWATIRGPWGRMVERNGNLEYPIDTGSKQVGFPGAKSLDTAKALVAALAGQP